MSEPPFWSSRLLPSAQLRAIEVGAQLVLFHVRHQRLFDLNETAAAIWQHLSDGLACAEIAERLHALGTARAHAGDFTALAVTEWLRSGFVTPLEVATALAGRPCATRRLRVGSISMQLRFFAEADAEATAAVFQQFSCDGAEAQIDIAIVACKGFEFLFLGEEPIGMSAPGQAIPALKALITAQYCGAVPEGFVAHGGLVSANGRRVFLSGAPGAGKSTLALALTSRHFAYASDDIVHIDADGMAEGIPFAAAAKSTAWDLLRSYLPHLDTLPSYERNDAQIARYVLPEQLDRGGPRPIDIALLLERKAGAEARFDAVTPLEMLCVVLDSGYTSRHAIDPRTLGRLAQNLSQARSFRFTYDDLPAAVDAVERLVRE